MSVTIHSDNWRVPNFTCTGPYICQTIILSAWPVFGCIVAPHLGEKLKNAIAFTQTSKITHINTHMYQDSKFLKVW